MGSIVIFPPPQSRPMRVTPKTLAVLAALNRYYLLTVEQVCRLFWSPTSLKRVYEVMKQLADGKYASVVFLPNEKARGRDTNVYRLGTNGLKLLRRYGHDVPTRLRLSEEPRQDHLSHTLAVNDVLIAAELLGRTQAHVVLNHFIHERTLKLKPPKVTLPDGRRQGVIPDGILDFDITDPTGEWRQLMLLEVDLGAKQLYWKRKMERLLIYGETRFAKDYDSQSFTIGVVAPSGETHLHNLKQWTEETITAMGKSQAQWSQLIYFTSRKAGQTDPRTFFLSPSWYPAFGTAPTLPLEVYLG